MLSNGCICCQAGSDLAYTIDRLLATERPGATGPLRRLVLETSGLSKPGPVLRQLGGLAEHRLRVSVLATYDATRGPETAAFEEAAAQWAAAHRIVVTKTDAVSPEALARAKEEIASLNPLAEIVAMADRDRRWRRPSRRSPVSRRCLCRRRLATPAHARIAVRLARPTGVLGYDDLATWLDNLAGALGERLLRLKGLVRVQESERPLLVQSVGTLFSPPRPFGEPAGIAAALPGDHRPRPAAGRAGNRRAGRAVRLFVLRRPELSAAVCPSCLTGASGKSSVKAKPVAPSGRSKRSTTSNREPFQWVGGVPLLTGILGTIALDDCLVLPRHQHDSGKAQQLLHQPVLLAGRVGRVRRDAEPWRTAR